MPDFIQGAAVMGAGDKLHAWLHKQLHHYINEGEAVVPEQEEDPPPHRTSSSTTTTTRPSPSPSRKQRVREARKGYRSGKYKKRVYPTTYVPDNPIIYAGQPR